MQGIKATSKLEVVALLKVRLREAAENFTANPGVVNYRALQREMLAYQNAVTNRDGWKAPYDRTDEAETS